MIPKDNLSLVAADIAESVLHLFENDYPNDDRPRKAIEAARGNDREATLVAAKKADNSANSVGNYASFYAAASAAAHFQAIGISPDPTNPDASAAHYAAYHAANAVLSSSHCLDDKKSKEIRTIILKYWK